MGEYDDIEQQRYFEDHEIRALAARLFDEHPDAVRRYMLEADMGMVDLKGREMPQGDFKEVAGPAYAEAMVNSAITWWDEIIHSDRDRPNALPDDFQKEIDLQVLSKDGLLIQYLPVEERTHDLLLTVVSNNGIALSFVPGIEQTQDLQVAAYKQNPDSLAYVHDHLKDAVVSAATAKPDALADDNHGNPKERYAARMDALFADMNAQVENLYPKNTTQPETPQATASTAPEVEAPASILDVTDANAHLFKPAQAGSMLTPAEQDSLRQEMAENLVKMEAIYRGREDLPQAMEQTITEPAHELATATEAQRLESVREDGLMLQHIPADQQSLDVQVEAVMQNEQALAFVPGDDAENVLREASLRAEDEPFRALEIEDPRVDFEAAGYQELSYQPDILPAEDYDLYFEGAAFDPMQADHLEGFDLRVNSHDIFIEFSGVDVDGNIQKYSLTEYQVMTMEDSPLKELVTGEIQGGIDRLEMMREGIALDAAKAEGVNGTPVESVGISGTHGDGLVATVRMAGSNEDMQIPLNPETFKPLREEHHTFEHIIELSARQDHTPVPGNLDDAKIKAAELSELLDEPVRVNECQGLSEGGDSPGYGFEIEIGEGGSKKKIHAMNMADLHRQLDEEIIKDRERTGVINVHKETFVTQHDTCVSPGQPEAHKQEVQKPEEVEQEKKRSVGI